jgi:hypothetical protein
MSNNFAVETRHVNLILDGPEKIGLVELLVIGNLTF